MDPKLIFWTAALVNFSLVVACAAAGWWSIRQRHLKRHKRLMHTAAALVGLFLAGYVLKVIFLGKENLELWSRADVWWLRIHETIVLIMLVAGVTARVLARRFRHGGRLDPWRSAAGLERARARHRWAGRTAVVASLLACLTAAIVLAGMYARAAASDRARLLLEVPASASQVRNLW